MSELQKQERDALVFRPDKQLTQEIMQAFTWKYPFAGYENLPAKSSATKLSESFSRAEVYSADETEHEEIEYASQNKTDKETGIAYHAFLENFDFSTLYENGEFVGEERLKELVQNSLQWIKEVGMYETKYLSCEKLIEILSNPVFFELQGKNVYKEQKFLALLPVKDTYANSEGAPTIWKEHGEEEIIFQGAVDLLAVGEDGAHIVDYKYSAGGADYLREHYRAQLDLYRKVTSKILNIPIEKIRCTIVNINRGFQVDIE
jgi:ATP-dependent exoDNAse (exonuclease V) beta subunit